MNDTKKMWGKKIKSGKQNGNKKVQAKMIKQSTFNDSLVAYTHWLLLQLDARQRPKLENVKYVLMHFSMAI